MKKLIALLFMSILVLFGCSSSGSSSDTVEQTTVDTLNWVGYYVYGDVQTGEWAQWNEEISGQAVNYTAMPATDPLSKYRLDLSSNADYHMMSLWPTEFIELANEGILLDISPYLEEYAPDIMAAYTEEEWATVTDPETGAIYGVPRLGQSDIVISSIVWREDILAQYGYEVPTTTEEFANVTCGLAAEGMQTPYALTGGAFGESVLRGSFGVTWEWNYDENGDLVHISQDPRYMDYINFMNELYSCGALGNDSEQIDQATAIERFIQGNSVAMTINHWDASKVATGLQEVGVNYTEALVLTPSITGPDGYADVKQAGPQIDFVIAIPEYQEQYAGQVLSYLNSFFTPEIQQEMVFGTPGVEGDPESGNYIIDEEGNVQFYTMVDGVPVAYIPREAWVGLEVPSAPEYRVQQREASKNTAIALNEAGQIDTVEEASYWYDANTIPYAEQGVTNPLATEIFTPAYSEVSAPLTQSIADFTVLSITTGLTEEEFTAYAETTKGEYNLEAVTTELNDAVK